MMAIILTCWFFNGQCLWPGMGALKDRPEIFKTVRNNFNPKKIHQFPLKKIGLSKPKPILLAYYNYF